MKTFDSVEKRRKWLESETGVLLPHIATFSLDEKIASTRHCENMIGAVQVPLGVAGKLAFNQKESKNKEYFIPLATTEAALIASVNRGCKAITLSGGVTAMSHKVGITRAPVFAVENISKGQEFVIWVEKNKKILKSVIESISDHLTLIDIRSWQLGKNVYLRFRMDSQEAMGMNMATIAVQKVVEYIEKHVRIRCVALSGNMCVDKKNSALNFIEGRGYTVLADAVIPSDILSSVLKTSAEELAEVAQRKIV